MSQDQRADARAAETAPENHPLGSYDPLAEVDPRLAGIRRSGPWVAIQLGVPLFAAGAGLACYYFLTTFGFNAFIALALGFGFALLVRVAARSLLIEWLVARARAHAEAKAATHTVTETASQSDAPPESPDNTPPARH